MKQLGKLRHFQRFAGGGWRHAARVSSVRPRSARPRRLRSCPLVLPRLALQRSSMKQPGIKRFVIGKPSKIYSTGTSGKNSQSGSEPSHDFYQEIFCLKKCDFTPGSNKRPMMMAKLTADLVYSRLDKGGRKSKLFQWLSPDWSSVLKNRISGITILSKSA